MKVAKFGGTSLANAEQIRKVCDIITADPERRIVVVSAPGKRHKTDDKVTDLLIAFAERLLRDGEAEQEIRAVIARYREIGQELGIPEQAIDGIEKDLRELLTLDTSVEAKFLDRVKAAGEDNSAKVVAHYLNSIGVPASYVNPWDAGLLVCGKYGNAQVLPESYERLRALRDREGIVVFPGFFGYATDGSVVTFSRGGSDITGSILAAAVQADLYENFTDVDSVFAVNPSLIPQPKQVTELTYQEMRELSYAGFSVYHAEALFPAFRTGVPVCIKNTNNPTAPGTMIVSKRSYTSTNVVGIAGDAGFCSIYLTKYLMNREVGFGRKLLQILEEEGLSYEHIPSGIDHVSVILRNDIFTREIEERVISRIRTELQVDDVQVARDLALVMIVGEGMRENVGTVSRAAIALADAGINIEMINQGSSEVSLMFAVKDRNVKKAIVSLYHEFFGRSRVLYDEVLNLSLDGLEEQERLPKEVPFTTVA
ncbi:aspartate kinase [Brevibacillus dissolubilis]|uniref:aspartate kinase n=1 Tax=Brevibacillus dissolubilis TaxID=1844116 RepID=UPI0011176AA6|nr:aspartate kinase [Brevibacillus dissolubilis]